MKATWSVRTAAARHSRSLTRPEPGPVRFGPGGGYRPRHVAPDDQLPPRPAGHRGCANLKHLSRAIPLGPSRAVGLGVTGFAVGDEVIGTAAGSLAEYALILVARLAHAPSSATPEAAATLPISWSDRTPGGACCAHHRGRPGADHRCPGRVTGSAVQIAASAGALVTAVASGAKEDFVQLLGATTFIDYTGGLIDRTPDPPEISPSGQFHAIPISRATRLFVELRCRSPQAEHWLPPAPKRRPLDRRCATAAVMRHRPRRSYDNASPG